MRCDTTALTVGLVLILAFGSDALAQRGSTPKQPEKPAVKTQEKGATKAQTRPAAKEEATPTTPPAPPSPPQQVVMPDAEKIVLLVRTTLLTLDDAIQTGNFTVMRDKSAPGFRENNSASQLGQIFSGLAKSGVDISVVSVMTPQLSETPVLDQEKGMLNIKGFFPSRPTRIDFELLFQSVGGRWKLFGLSVQPVQPPAAPQASSGGSAPAARP
jgi:hypothetical protein